MDIFLFFLATIIAYRMGARGGWLFAIFMFSWLAFVPWLVLRSERPRREDAEMKRTLMIVRAINPAMADEIEVNQAIERTLAAERTKPARPARRPRSGRQVALIVAALIAALVLINAIAPRMVPPEEHHVGITSNSAFPHERTEERPAAVDRGEARDPVTGATYKERESVKLMIEASTGGPFGRPLPPGETVESATDDVLLHLQALGIGKREAAPPPPTRAEACARLGGEHPVGVTSHSAFPRDCTADRTDEERAAALGRNP
jgi:hypothetical protein